MSAWGGISSLQFGLSLFWTEGKRRGLTLQDVNKFLAHGPAKLAGLDDRKGKIKVGPFPLSISTSQTLCAQGANVPTHGIWSKKCHSVLPAKLHRTFLVHATKSYTQLLLFTP